MITVTIGKGGFRFRVREHTWIEVLWARKMRRAS